MGRCTGRVLIVAVTGSLIVVGTTAAAGEGSTPIRLPFEPSTRASHVVVVRGDHLWKISDRHLQSVHGGEAGTADVTTYWRLVIEENRTSLRSGDPDLIYPGEVIELPRVP